jgi:hypothetical protein
MCVVGEARYDDSESRLAWWCGVVFWGRLSQLDAVPFGGDRRSSLACRRDVQGRARRRVDEHLIDWMRVDEGRRIYTSLAPTYTDLTLFLHLAPYACPVGAAACRLVRTQASDSWSWHEDVDWIRCGLPGFPASGKTSKLSAHARAILDDSGYRLLPTDE